VLITVSFVEGCDENDDPAGLRGVGIVPGIEQIVSSFFDLQDIDNAFVEFSVEVVNPDEVSSIIIEVTYEGTKGQLETYTSLPATVTVTAQEAVQAVGVSISDLTLGDVFTFEIVVNAKSGTSSRSNSILNATVACESMLTGEYSCVASGQSTDTGPGPDVNPISGFETTVTLTEQAVNGEYIISDFSGGLFTLWYSIYGLSGDYPGFFKDVCGDVSYINTVGPFGSPISGTGSVDPATGVITLSGLADWWGDNWSLVLTPR
jgi:hypothetical protein